ncbi:MAG TPA: GNAT family N-acetyltransferase [Spirochaetota bacterium]|nr:GNAT family N-acetyltransferase [Spirochaetota bacterium]HOR45557.1 GNAT family N-acetyltransferase [Spirochaetota bacterium]HOU85634.1 GNAT family N-acetyltransferase [Spirochaetota bacterium]HPK57140.1 GNAT family N-acetyltransferase [Spirochaetota bacterium]HQE59618.1 GNAT family N-acetyltransferase [Spirochaetota bacterium]
MQQKQYKIYEASEADCIEILVLQKLCYHQEAEIYNDFSIQPLSQTDQELKDEFTKCIFLKCLCDQSIIGSVRAFETDKTCFIGKLIVHPEYQNIGIGRELMNQIEYKFSNSARFELFTGSESIKNISLYQKLGYNIFKREKLKPSLELVFLEKINSGL